jgi:hypothetical protein
MLHWLRGRAATKVLADEKAFWRYCNATQRITNTPDGDASEAEERLDFEAGSALKGLLEAEVGPEEGSEQLQAQNWDWNDDRTRGVYVLKRAFRPELLPKLQSFLAEQFPDFRIILMIHESWGDAMWGGIVITPDRIVIQRNVAVAYAVA